MEKFIRLFERLIRPLKRQVLLMVGRGILLAVDSTKDIQVVQVSLLADETKDKTEMMQHFGFTSRPPAESDCIMLSVGGNRDHGIIISSEHRQYRLKGLDDGDSAMYNKKGKYLWSKGDNLEGLVSKIKINNGQNELITVIHEFFEEVRDGLTITAIGPQPWAADTIIKLQAVIDKLETFKV